jgi:hypothetical protein
MSDEARRCTELQLGAEHLASLTTDCAERIEYLKMARRYRRRALAAASPDPPPGE